MTCAKFWRRFGGIFRLSVRFTDPSESLRSTQPIPYGVALRVGLRSQSARPLFKDMCLTFGPRSVGCKVEISNHIEAVKDADRRR